MPLYLLLGEDELGKSRRLLQLKQEADGGSGMLDSNISYFSGRDAKPGEILMQCQAMPFLAPRRLVIVEDILVRFRGRQESAVGAETDSRAMKQFKPFFESVAAGVIPPTTDLIFTGGGEQRPGPFTREFAKLPGAEVETFAAPRNQELYRFVREEAGLRGVHFKSGPSRRALTPGEEWRRPQETDPAILLANLHQPADKEGRNVPDTMSISNDLQKLSLFAMGRDVTVDDIDEVCSGGREPTRWKFQDWVLDGDSAEALNALAYFEESGESLQALLGTLMSGYRQLASVLELLDGGASQAQVQTSLRRSWGADKIIGRARNHGWPGIRAAYEAMVAADRATKAGESDEGLSMAVLVARLCAIAGANRQGRRATPPGRTRRG